MPSFSRTGTPVCTITHSVAMLGSDFTSIKVYFSKQPIHFLNNPYKTKVTNQSIHLRICFSQCVRPHRSPSTALNFDDNRTRRNLTRRLTCAVFELSISISLTVTTTTTHSDASARAQRSAKEQQRQRQRQRQWQQQTQILFQKRLEPVSASVCECVCVCACKCVCARVLVHAGTP